jgi:hypothetical protein
MSVATDATPAKLCVWRVSHYDQVLRTSSKTECTRATSKARACALMNTDASRPRPVELNATTRNNASYLGDTMKENGLNHRRSHFSVYVMSWCALRHQVKN